MINKSQYYSEDTRLNLYELKGKEGKKIANLAEGVACLIETKLLHEIERGYSLIKPYTEKGPISLNQFIYAKYDKNLKTGEKFPDEPLAGIGTAFLISKHFALTAAHCLCDDKRNTLDEEKVKNLRLVFVFKMKDEKNPVFDFKREQVYRIKNVAIYRNEKVEEEKADWALLKLDREVWGQTPLKLSSPDFFYRKWLKISMLGHPVGLPLKFTAPGIIQKVGKISFECQIDAFKCNSGSPLFFEGKVVGILLAGNEDYHVQNGEVTAICTSISGEIEKKGYEKCFKITSDLFREVICQKELHLDILTLQQTALPLSHSNVKKSHPDFIGREEILKSLETILLAPAKTLKKALLWSSGGMGKSETAVLFANKHQDAFSLIHWIDASTKETLLRSYQNLQKALKLPMMDKEPFDDLRNRIHTVLSKMEKPFLLIYDNVEEPLPLPTSGSLLLTSRHKALFKGIPCIEMPLFSREESQALLHYITGEKISALFALAESLEDYPLALTQAAHYIRENGLTAEEYLEALKQIETGGENKALLQHSRTLEKSWLITEKRLAKENPQALNFLRLIAYLHPDTIPESFLTHFVKETYPLDSQVQQYEEEKILTILINYGLIRHWQEENLLSIHRLKQQAIRSSSAEGLKKLYVLLEKKIGPLSDSPGEEERAVYKTYAPHLHYLLCSHPLESKEALTLLHKLSWWEYLESHYKEGLLLAQKELDLATKLKDKKGRGDALNCLGTFWQNLDKLGNALECHEKSLLIRKELFGNKHSAVAASLHSMGNFWQALGKLDKARKCYEESLMLRRELFGNKHTTVADSLNNLGSIWRAIGNLHKAQECFEESFKIRIELFGNKHTEVATSLNNLGNLWKTLGKLDKAQECYEKSLTIYREMFGNKHANVAISLNNLGALLKVLGKLDKAQECYEESLLIKRELFGNKHSEVAQSINNVGALWQALGKLDKAEECYEESLFIMKEALGDHHPSIKIAADNLEKLKKQKESGFCVLC